MRPIAGNRLVAMSVLTIAYIIPHRLHLAGLRTRQCARISRPDM